MPHHPLRVKHEDLYGVNRVENCNSRGSSNESGVGALSGTSVKIAGSFPVSSLDEGDVLVPTRDGARRARGYPARKYYPPPGTKGLISQCEKTESWGTPGIYSCCQGCAWLRRMRVTLHLVEELGQTNKTRK